MKNNLEIKTIERVYDGHFKVQRLVLRFRQFSGDWSPPIIREQIQRGDACALLLYDPKLDKVVLVEQLRIGAIDISAIRDYDWALGGNMAKEQESSTAPAFGMGDKEVVPEGATVLQEVVQMTGLSEEYLNSEISEFLGTSNNVNELSLEQLRAALLNYLETINDEITQTQTPN